MQDRQGPLVGSLGPLLHFIASGMHGFQATRALVFWNEGGAGTGTLAPKSAEAALGLCIAHCQTTPLWLEQARMLPAGHLQLSALWRITGLPSGVDKAPHCRTLKPKKIKPEKASHLGGAGIAHAAALRREGVVAVAPGVGGIRRAQRLASLVCGVRQGRPTLGKPGARVGLSKEWPSMLSAQHAVTSVLSTQWACGCSSGSTCRKRQLQLLEACILVGSTHSPVVQVPQLSPTSPAGQGRSEAAAVAVQAATSARQSSRRAYGDGVQSSGAWACCHAATATEAAAKVVGP